MAVIPGQNGGYPVEWSDGSEWKQVGGLIGQFLQARRAEQQRRLQAEQEAYQRQRQAEQDDRARKADAWELDRHKINVAEANMNKKRFEFDMRTRQAKEAEDQGAAFVGSPSNAARIQHEDAYFTPGEQPGEQPPPGGFPQEPPPQATLPAITGLEPGDPNIAEQRSFSPFQVARQRLEAIAAAKRAEVEQRNQAAYEVEAARERAKQPGRDATAKAKREGEDQRTAREREAREAKERGAKARAEARGTTPARRKGDKDPARLIKYQGRSVPFNALPPELQEKVLASGG